MSASCKEIRVETQERWEELVASLSVRVGRYLRAGAAFVRDGIEHRPPADYVPEEPALTFKETITLTDEGVEPCKMN